MTQAKFAIEQGMSLTDLLPGTIWKIGCTLVLFLMSLIINDLLKKESMKEKKKKNHPWNSSRSLNMKLKESSWIPGWNIRDWFLAESQTLRWHHRVNDDLPGSPRLPLVCADLAGAGALQAAGLFFHAFLNGSHAGKPVAQFSLCHRRSEMEVTERATIRAEQSCQSRLSCDCGQRRFVCVTQQ